MRFRTLVCLLALTAGDCLLWHWSIAAERDVAALATGLALLPLIALSLGMVLLTCGRLLARSTSLGSSAAASTPSRPVSRATAEHQAQPGRSAAETESSPSRRLAA